MADNPAANLFNLMPGFALMQSMVKSAGSAVPGIGHWVTPTLDPDELEKRINELRTVQFWLEQNARLLATTIQALEVQRMTLTTLRTMNVQMGDLTEALKIKLPEADAAPAPAPAFSVPPFGSTAAAAAAAPPAASDEAAKPDATPASGLSGLVDPMQWWGALTQQFGALASTALRDGAAAIPGFGGGAKDADSAGAKSSAGAAAEGHADAAKPAGRRKAAPKHG